MKPQSVQNFQFFILKYSSETIALVHNFDLSFIWFDAGKIHEIIYHSINGRFCSNGTTICARLTDIR